MAAALDTAPRFRLKATESKKFLREVFTAVSGWRETGDGMGGLFNATLGNPTELVIDLACVWGNLCW